MAASGRGGRRPRGLLCGRYALHFSVKASNPPGTAVLPKPGALVQVSCARVIGIDLQVDRCASFRAGVVEHRAEQVAPGTGAAPLRYDVNLFEPSRSPAVLECPHQRHVRNPNWLAPLAREQHEPARRLAQNPIDRRFK